MTGRRMCHSPPIIGPPLLQLSLQLSPSKTHPGPLQPRVLLQPHVPEDSICICAGGVVEDDSDCGPEPDDGASAVRAVLAQPSTKAMPTALPKYFVISPSQS